MPLSRVGHRSSTDRAGPQLRQGITYLACRLHAARDGNIASNRPRTGSCGFALSGTAHVYDFPCFPRRDIRTEARFGIAVLGGYSGPAALGLSLHRGVLCRRAGQMNPWRGAPFVDASHRHDGGGRDVTSSSGATRQEPEAGSTAPSHQGALKSWERHDLSHSGRGFD